MPRNFNPSLASTRVGPILCCGWKTVEPSLSSEITSCRAATFTLHVSLKYVGGLVGKYSSVIPELAAGDSKIIKSAVQLPLLCVFSLSEASGPFYAAMLSPSITTHKFTRVLLGHQYELIMRALFRPYPYIQQRHRSGKFQ